MYFSKFLHLYQKVHISQIKVDFLNKYNDNHLLLNSDTTNDEVFEQYLNGLRDLKGSTDNFNWEIGVSSKDKVLCLSTCVRNEDEKRYLVQAKLIAVEEVSE